MSLGLAPTQGDLMRSTVNYCEGRVAEDSIYSVLHRECFRGSVALFDRRSC